MCRYVDAELAHLLRRGGYRLDHIADVLRRVRDAGGAEPLAASLLQWRKRLTERGQAMLTGAARLAEYTEAAPGAPNGHDDTGLRTFVLAQVGGACRW